MERYWQIYLHLVWGTQERSHLLRGSFQRHVHRAIRARCRQRQLVAVSVNSAWNHIHTLVSWNPELSPDQVVNDLKEHTVDVWEAARRGHSRVPPLQWQEGYGGFSVYPGAVPRVKKYIFHQKRLHRTDSTIDHFETWATVD